MANWREAAELYRQAHLIVEKEKLEERLNQAAEQLHDFLAGDSGAAARELLKASCRWVEFGREYDHSTGLFSIYSLDQCGLIRYTIRDPSLEIDYDESQPLIVSRITAMEAVLAAVRFGNKDPDKFLDWLRAELDKIAAAAPEPK